MIRLELPLPPSGNTRNSTYAKRGKVVHKRRLVTQKFYDLTFYKFLQTKQQTIDTFCRVNVVLYMTNKNRDADNAIKTLFDALEYGKVIKNDKLIKQYSVEVINDTKENKVVVDVQAIEKPPKGP